MFAPLSPTSSRRLAKIHKHSEGDPDSMHSGHNGHAEPHNLNTKRDIPVNNSSDTDSRRHRRRRRTSDPSSDRIFNQPSKHRRRHHRASASQSPRNSSEEDEVELLPDRFDEQGRPLDRHGDIFSTFKSLRGLSGGGKQSEMVEKIVRDVGDVVEGRKTWRDMLADVVREQGRR